MTRHMTATELQTLASSPRQSRRERQITTLRADGVRSHIIAQRLGISAATVTSVLSKVRKRAGIGSGEPVSRAINPPIDEAWYERQVAYVRSLEHDAEHQGRYLRGIAVAHGDAVAARVDRDASAGSVGGAGARCSYSDMRE
jgi:DNA-binding CsgD family transcriptional regulator